MLTRTPLSLLPIEETGDERTKFRMNTSFVHTSGVLLLDFDAAANGGAGADGPTGKTVIAGLAGMSAMGGKDPVLVGLPSPIAPNQTFEMGGGGAGADFRFDNMDDDMGDDGFGDPIEDMNATAATVAAGSGAGPRRGFRARTKVFRPVDLGDASDDDIEVEDEPDPWTPLDPHADLKGGNRPFRRGKTYKIPKAVPSAADAFATLDFGRTHEKLPKQRNIGPSFPEFGAVFWDEQARRKTWWKVRLVGWLAVCVSGVGPVSSLYHAPRRLTGDKLCSSFFPPKIYALQTLFFFFPFLGGAKEAAGRRVCRWRPLQVPHLWRRRGGGRRHLPLRL